MTAAPVTDPGTGGTGGGPFGGGVPTPPNPGADTTAPSVTVAAAKVKLKALLRKGLARDGLLLGGVHDRRAAHAAGSQGRQVGGTPRDAQRGEAAARPAGIPRGRLAPFRPRAPRLAKTQVIGRGSGRLTAAGKAKVTLKLTAKARKALKRARSLKATLTVTARDAAGNTGTASRKVTAKR